MSGIYLRGVGMPNACMHHCPVAGWACLLWKKVDYPTAERHKDCPLVEIPDNGFVIVPKKGGTENEKEELG